MEITMLIVEVIPVFGAKVRFAGVNLCVHLKEIEKKDFSQLSRGVKTIILISKHFRDFQTHFISLPKAWTGTI